MRQQHLSVRVSDEQKHALEEAAAREDTTVGAIVRRAVSSLLGGQPASPSVVHPQPVVTHVGKRISRDREMQWLRQHRSELSNLDGQYVIVEGDELIAHGTDLKTVVEEARTRGVLNPFIERLSVPADRPDFWMGL